MLKAAAMVRANNDFGPQRRHRADLERSSAVPITQSREATRRSCVQQGIAQGGPDSGDSRLLAGGPNEGDFLSTNGGPVSEGQVS